MWQLLFARVLHASVSLAETTALAVCVWMIYAADRLMDVAQRPGYWPTARHRFHARHSLLLSVLCVVAAAVLIVCSLLLPARVLDTGAILAAIVAAYFAAVHTHFRLPKEAAVGCLFAIGCALAPACQARNVWELAGPVLCFGILCFLNCASIEVWEGVDQTDRCTRWAARHARSIMALLGVAAVILKFQGILDPMPETLIICAVAFLAWDFSKPFLSPDVTRLLADFPLLAPAILLLAGR